MTHLRCNRDASVTARETTGFSIAPMDLDDVIEVFVGTLAALLVFWFVVLPMRRRGWLSRWLD